MSIRDIKESIRNVPDFPKPGVQFKDITTALKQPKIFNEIIENLAAHFAETKPDYVVGIEARGFIFGATLAYCLGCGFIPMRKRGKLPANTISTEYNSEYGTDILEIHEDALKPGDKVLIVDDVLAVGGTAQAAAKLIQKLGAEICAFAFIIELPELNGRKKLAPEAEIYSLLQF